LALELECRGMRLVVAWMRRLSQLLELAPALSVMLATSPCPAPRTRSGRGSLSPQGRLRVCERGLLAAVEYTVLLGTLPARRALAGGV